MPNLLEEEIKERLPTKHLDKFRGTSSETSLSKVICFRVDNGESIFVKISNSVHAATMFAGEMASLKQIQSTNTVRVPKPRLVLPEFDGKGNSALIIEYLDIEPLSDRAARDLGRDLANLHLYNYKSLAYFKRASKWIGGRAPSSQVSDNHASKTDYEDVTNDAEDEDEEGSIQFSKHRLHVRPKTHIKARVRQDSEYPERFEPEPETEPISQFGFDQPTTCGIIPQINDWTSDWVSFFARHRLEHQINMLLSEHGDRELNEQWSHLQLKVDKYFVDFTRDSNEKIIPALLHGDLWSGNVAQVNDEPVIYDPSSFYGHSEYDFGIARMFAGIPSSFEKSYFDIMPKKKLFERRNKLYQLFHHLNHWSHFGYGYRSSSLRLMRELNSLT